MGGVTFGVSFGVASIVILLYSELSDSELLNDSKGNDCSGIHSVNKYASIDFDKCNPRGCDGQLGMCEAVRSCKKKLLEQEEPWESPILISMKMCTGCGACVAACPLAAIEIKNG
jgi:NAD-dependent dihydropyrimidine dehydrogenase PreA subunit